MNERARFWIIAAAVAAVIAVLTILVTGGRDTPAAPDEPAARVSESPPAPAAPAQPVLLGGAAPAQAPAVREIRKASSPPPQQRSALIAGWVVYEDGRPAPRVPITAHWTPLAAPTLRGMASPEFQTESGADGRFAFGRLDDGFYILAAYEGEWMATDFAPASDGRKVDVVLVLKAAAEISGRVLDAAGEPVPGAMVHALRSKQPTPIPPVSTGADGAFHLRVAPGAPVQLLAEAAGHPSVLTDEIEPGASGVDIVLTGGAALTGKTIDAGSGAPVGAVRMVLVATEMSERGVELRSGPDGAFRIDGLVPGTYALRVVDRNVVLPVPIDGLALLDGAESRVTVSVAPAGAIRGRVVNATRHAPAAGVVIEARRYDGLSSGEPRSYRAEPSDAEGAFVLTGLPEGVYELTAEPAGRLFGATPSRIRLITSQRIAETIVTMHEGMTITGRVETANGEPAPGAIVLVANAADRHRHVTADEDGAFEALGVIPMEETQVMAEWGAYRSEPAFVSFGPDGPGEVLLRLTAELTMPNLNRDEPSEPVGVRTVSANTIERPTGPFEIRGEVRNENGEPVAGAMVGAGGPEPAITDARGRFTLDSLAEGQHLVHASHPEWGTGSIEAAAGARGVVIALIPHDFRGRVVDASTGAPITRFSIGIPERRMGPARMTGETLWFDDSEGRFSFAPRRRNFVERAELAAGAEGYAEARVEAALGQEIVIGLERGRRVAGLVIDGENRPVAGAFVYENAPDRLDYQAVTDADGAFLLTSVGIDTRVITAQRPGFADGSAELPARGDVENLVIRLGAGTDLEVRVDSGPWPRESVVVYLLEHAGDLPTAGKPLDADGVCRFERVAAGPVTVRIVSSHEAVHAPNGRWNIEIPYEVRPQGPNQISAALPPFSATLDGAVTRDGEPVPDTDVRLIYHSASAFGEFSGRTDASGYYRFDLVPAGTARVTVEGSGIGLEAVLNAGAGTRMDIDLTPAP